MKQLSLGVRASAALAICALAVPSFALQSDAGGTPVSSTAAASLDDAAQAQKLAGAILAALAAQGAGASEQDQEGLIVFAVSQDSYSVGAISSALDTVASGANESLSKAVANVRAALLKRKLKRGTAAIATNGLGGAGGTGGGGGFSAPGVSTGGGGSANYSN